MFRVIELNQHILFEIKCLPKRRVMVNAAVKPVVNTARVTIMLRWYWLIAL